ncbi:hypothetical protein PYW08_015616 [Mythimna loreyi]|uniref:Uncharacterized protein n=1 Tax=Mythimna loreyi TaxID=667449 RepID=A0ACC2QWR5_9NEOP|nr:hypothetical protein PYW08_015616 [Mythimna loreyi]
MQMLTSWKTESDDRLANWKSEHDAVLSRLTKDLSDLKIQISEIRESHLQLDRGMEFVNSCYEDIKNKVADMENHKKESDDRIYQLEQYIQDLQLQS